MDHFSDLREMMAATLGVEASRITPATTQADLAEWDSVGHLNIILSLEQTFQVRMEVEDMARLTSVKAILDYLETACPSK